MLDNETFTPIFFAAAHQKNGKTLSRQRIDFVGAHGIPVTGLYV